MGGAIMKKIISILLCVIMAFCFTGCSEETTNIEPDVTQIRSICNLSTLECYYHNVAKSIKKASTGISGWFEEDREFWIEYTGVAKIGIDMSKVSMEISGDVVTINMPSAKLFSVDILEKDLTKKSYISNEDGWLNSNKITAEDQTKAINDAQNKMKESVEGNTTLMLNARIRAEKLIENYIVQIGDISGVSYRIKWVYEDGTK